MDALEAIRSRHGVLRYLPRPVEPEKITAVLEAAISAPSAANTQPWDFIVVTDPELVGKVAGYLLETQERYVFEEMIELDADFTEHMMGWFEEFLNVPCIIVLCRNRRVDLADSRFDDVTRAWDLCTLGGAMANLMTAATALGLGTRWFGGFLADGGGRKAREWLRIPDDVEIVGATPLGYHEEPAKGRPVQSLDVLTGFRRGDKHKLAALLDGKVPLDQVTHHNGYPARA